MAQPDGVAWQGRRTGGAQRIADVGLIAPVAMRPGSFSGVITGAFLAEAASVVDNKLRVVGGVLSGFAVGPDRLAQFVLVVLTQAESDSPVRRIDVEIRPPTDDEPLTVAYELPDSAADGEIGFAFFDIEVCLPVDGRWVMVVTGGTGVISLPLQVNGE